MCIWLIDSHARLITYYHTMTNRLFDELFIIEINKVADCVRAGLLILSSTFVGELNFSSAVIIIKSFIYSLISFLSWRHGEKRFHTHTSAMCWEVHGIAVSSSSPQTLLRETEIYATFSRISSPPSEPCFVRTKRKNPPVWRLLNIDFPLFLVSDSLEVIFSEFQVLFTLSLSIRLMLTCVQSSAGRATCCTRRGNRDRRHSRHDVN